VALAYPNRTLGRAPGLGRLRHHDSDGLPLTTPQGQHGHAGAGAPGRLGRWQRAHWVTALPVGTGPRTRSGRGRARHWQARATAIAPLARPARPAAAGLGQGPFSSGPGPGMPAWHWHLQGEGLMVSANLKRRATRVARVQLDAYQEPRATSSSGHIVRLPPGDVLLGRFSRSNSAPAVTQPRSIKNAHASSPRTKQRERRPLRAAALRGSGIPAS
jgi:hypothetical protein